MFGKKKCYHVIGLRQGDGWLIFEIWSDNIPIIPDIGESIQPLNSKSEFIVIEKRHLISNSHQTVELVLEEVK